MPSGSKGILDGLKNQNKNSLESKNLTSKEDEKLSIKRSYTLKASTVKKLQELKIFEYPDPSVTYNEIVDEAICLLYDQKKSGNK